MNEYTAALRKTIEPMRQDLINHPLYGKLKSVEQLRTFMEYHVYAVWDFMSLLKSLQRQLTCTKLPWKPIGNASTRYLVNEIVLGEESDIDQDGNRLSHFELYLKAMKQAEADRSSIQFFLKCVTGVNSIENALQTAKIPKQAQQFVNFTFETIDEGSVATQAAVFTFGREDLLPDIFLSILKEIDLAEPGRISIFRYYIERHVEVDGSLHSDLAIQMTEELCGTDEKKWKAATKAVVGSLKARIKLWDAIAAKL